MYKKLSLHNLILNISLFIKEMFSPHDRPYTFLLYTTFFSSSCITLISYCIAKHTVKTCIITLLSYCICMLSAQLKLHIMQPNRNIPSISHEPPEQSSHPFSSSNYNHLSGNSLAFYDQIVQCCHLTHIKEINKSCFIRRLI